MRSHDLETRVDEFEAEIAALRQRTLLPPVGIRRRATIAIAHWPLYEIALGSDRGRGQPRGHAKAIVAIGDVASGVIAIGGYARGVIAIGGLATGFVSIGGLSLGLLSALGGLAIGGLSLGGAALGGVAVGGSAAGYYACGPISAGIHAVSPTRRSPEAGAIFRQLGLRGICDAQ
jgi:hypothetical protein